MKGYGWAYTTADYLVLDHPLILKGIVLLVSTTGGDVTLYEGGDTASGRLIGRFEAIADQSTPIDLFGLRLERGLYVDIGSNVTSILVIYDTVPSKAFPESKTDVQAYAVKAG